MGRARYVVSERPDAALLQGRTVLVLDDASASGGTLRAAHDFCVECGAAKVHCVALKVIGGYWQRHSPERLPAEKLALPAFTPWGTF